jgi:uncharacterized protein YjiS (DUF1127 family)
MLDFPMSDPLASRPRRGLGAKLWRVLGWPARVIEARRVLAQLAEFSDRELRDIGLTRQDLADCTALPRDDDPTERLARARAQRAWYSHPRIDKAA